MKLPGDVECVLDFLLNKKLARRHVLTRHFLSLKCHNVTEAGNVILILVRRQMGSAIYRAHRNMPDNCSLFRDTMIFGTTFVRVNGFLLLNGGGESCWADCGGGELVTQVLVKCNV
jgi:hypothetical protein